MTSKKITKNLEDRFKHNRFVWKDTIRVIDKYPAKETRKIKLDEISETSSEVSEGEEEKKYIRIFDQDLMTVLLAALDFKFKPLVLVSANPNYPLEGIKHGIISQEGDLFRISNLSQSINETLYPLQNNELLYCPELTIFKNTVNRLLLKPYKVPAILASPMRQPTILSIKTDRKMEEVYGNKHDEELMQQKIEAIFKLASEEQKPGSPKINCLILNGFGAYQGHPPHLIIQMFNKCIKKYPIKYIFFSIKSDDNLFETNSRSEISHDRTFELFHKHIYRFPDKN